MFQSLNIEEGTFNGTKNPTKSQLQKSSSPSQDNMLFISNCNYIRVSTRARVSETAWENFGKFKDKHLWVKKATGLGVTEFMLRIMAWLCTKDVRHYGHGNDNGQMCIVTGANIDIAIKLIKRMKGIFERKLGLVFQNKETVLDLNGFTIEAYPSNHLDSYRALTNPKFIFLDEADMFRKSEQDDVRHVSERYIGKSDPYIVMVSTPNAPGGLFESIEKESEETCIYKRLKMDYTYGLDKIYTKQEIDKARQSPSFEREYDLKYTGKIGNVFHTSEIDEAVARGETYDPERPVDMCAKSMGIDPGWGSSPFGIVITQFVDKTIQIIFAEEYERPDFEKMVIKVVSMLFKYRITKVYVDGFKSLLHKQPEKKDGRKS